MKWYAIYFVILVKLLTVDNIQRLIQNQVMNKQALSLKNIYLNQSTLGWVLALLGNFPS